MMDSRWLEILKASGWHTTFVAFACAIFLRLAAWGIIPTEAVPWIIPCAWSGLLICGALGLASISQSAVRTFPVHLWMQRRMLLRKAQRKVADYIPFMSDKERQIIGYLLHHRVKMFDCADSGCHAAPLIARGLVVVAAARGQIFDMERVPMAVPDHVLGGSGEASGPISTSPGNGRRR
jgi:hypothetical protein